MSLPPLTCLQVGGQGKHLEADFTKDDQSCGVIVIGTCSAKVDPKVALLPYLNKMNIAMLHVVG